MKGDLVKIKGLMSLYNLSFVLLILCVFTTGVHAQIDLDFSHKRGLYNSSFQLSITADDPTATIYYTTNGSHPTANNGSTYDSALTVNSTTTLKVIAIGSVQTSNLKVHSYIFPLQAINQPNSIPGYPSSNYALDSSILNHSTYGSQLLDGMHQIPTISVVMDLDTLNALHAGSLEYKTSFEVIMTDGAYTQEFGGIERAGGSSFNSRKRNLRITFKAQYGAKKLDFPLFGKDATNNIDQIAIKPGFHGCMNLGVNSSRAGSNDLADEIVRRFQINMSDDKIGLHGLFAHLYLNGVYWGVYNLTERANDGFNESYFGGDNEDYDVIKRKLASSGNLTAWNQLNNLANNTNLANQSNYDSIKNYIDVDNFAEYVILCNYAPHADDHLSGKNSFATMDRTKTDGFKFWIWDTEPALGHYWTWNVEPFGSRPYNNIFLSLLDNEDFKILVSDKIECNCYNDGPLDNNKSTQTYLDLYNSVNKAMLLEAARWQTVTEYTKFISTKDRIVNDYLPTRPDYIKNLYRTHNVFPNIEAVTFNHAGGIVPNGTQVALNNPNASGTIYYTTDGQDPRDSGGGINNVAQSISNNGSVTLTTGVVELKARIYQNGTWSAMCPKKFFVNQAYQNLQINEIHYNPLDSIGADGDVVDSDNFEFIEIKNSGNTTIHLEDVSLVDGISYTFEKNTTIAPGGFVVLAEGATQFQFLYGMAPTGMYSGKLKNSGEQVLLADPLDNIIDQVAYSDDPPWDDEADNGGPSLALLLTPNIDNALPESWAIQVVDYTPFAENAFCTPITINEFVFDVSCRNSNDGFLQVSVNGGASPYNYVWSNGGNSSSISSLSAGNYTVTVTDANLCTETKSLSVSQPSTVVSVAISKQDQINYNVNNGSATANPSGGTPGYSYSWSNGTSNQTANNLAPGNYTVTVSDDNNCTAIENISIDPVDCNIDASTNHSDVSYLGANDGSATASATGGPTPYSYSWSNGSSGASINNLSPGNYTVTITASNGCFDSASFTIDEVDCSLNANATHTDVTYLASNDGTATASASGGPSPYTFSWSNGSNAASINNLAPGDYTVTVTAANGCFDSATITIDEVDCTLNASASHTDVTYLASNDGTATANASNGPSPYSYAWSNGQSTKTINNLSPGNYTVTVTAANGCFDSETITIDEVSCSLSASTSQTNVTYFGSNNGTAIATASGGPSPFSYSWSNGSNTSTVNNLTPGNYNVTVTAANGCFDLASLTIHELDCASFSLSLTKTDETYLNTDDGTATANPVGTAPFTYAWSNGQNTKIINNLSPGNYTVTATDALGCSAIQSINIDAIVCNNFSLSSTSTNVTNVGADDGTATANPIGVAPFIYTWSNGASSSTITGLAPGSYTFTVVDAIGCSGTAAVNIGDINCTGINLSISSTDESIFGIADGTASALPSGGNAPYTFNWSNGQSTTSISNLAASNYQLTITDQLGCSIMDDVEILAGNTGEIFGKIYMDHNQDDQFNAGDEWMESMAVIISESDGNTKTVYTDEDGLWQSIVKTGLTSVDIDESNLPADASQTTSTDPSLHNIAQGEIKDAGLDGYILLCANFALSHAIHQMVSCHGLSDGSVSFQTTGGKAPYSYVWSDGSNNNSRNNLNANNYSITLTDDNGCKSINSLTITEPDLLTASINKTDETFNDADDGTATLNVNGGTLPYSYLWSNGANSSSISNLPPGNYSVVITDAKGCTANQSVSINPVNCLNISVSSTHTDISYNGLSDGTASATASGGATPYSYSWSNGANSQSIDNLAAGNYSLSIIDNLGCQIATSLTIDPVDCSSLILNVTSTDLSAFGSNDGTATAIPFGGTAPFTYIWNTGQTLSSLNGKEPGTYEVTVTDNLGCESYGSSVINNVDCSSLSLIVNASDETQYQANDGAATASPSGGQSPYAYIWSNGATSQTISNLPPGSYSLTLTDDNACTTIKSFNILQAQTGFLSGRIYEDRNNSGSFDGTDTGFENIDIQITESNGSTQTVTTDADGNWVSIVRPGISLVDILDSGALLADAFQSEGNDPTLITANLGQTVAAGDDGFNFFTELCGMVFYDNNSNGVKNNNELTLANVEVIITDQLGIEHILLTNANGEYCTEIIPGNTTIYINENDPNFPSGALVTQNQNPQNLSITTGLNQAFDMGFFREMNLDLKVYLQGALNVGSGQTVYGTEMRTELNEIQALPGQTYLGGLFSDVYFPPGQPYNQEPWYYNGSEGAGFDSGGDPNQGDAGYPTDVVDWVLISLRTGLDKSDEVCIFAGLLMKDGQVLLVEDFDCENLENDFYVVIEHRNHLIIMSHNKISLNGGLLSYDFTANQSYSDAFGLSSAQKEIVNVNGQNTYVMFSGNADQVSSNSADTDINVNDKIIWEQSNNDFPVYLGGDFDLSGDTNVNDKLLWDSNNNNFSSVSR